MCRLSRTYTVDAHYGALHDCLPCAIPPCVAPASRRIHHEPAQSVSTYAYLSLLRATCMRCRHLIPPSRSTYMAHYLPCVTCDTCHLHHSATCSADFPAHSTLPYHVDIPLPVIIRMWRTCRVWIRQCAHTQAHPPPTHIQRHYTPWRWCM